MVVSGLLVPKVSCLEMAYGVGDHGREDGSVGIVCVEFAHQDGDHGELDDEDDGMEQRLDREHPRQPDHL